MEKPITFRNVEELAITLARTASVTDSSGEKAYPAFLLSVLEKIPYFRSNPDHLTALPIEGDPGERSNVFALVRGSGPRCVVLTGHYDVVETSMYGSFEPWAFDPETLTRKFVEAGESAEGKDSPLHKIRADLESGEFLAGRGILDMKSGLAAGIAALERFSAPYERIGNVLFLAVADEEGSSKGMKAAARQLAAFLSSNSLEPSLIINLDSAVDQDDGEMGRAVFTGSVGKTLPFAYFIGRRTHAGAPFDGINPVLPAAEFAMEVECSPDAFKERQIAPGEEAAPPTILYFRESRSSYDVTTPPAVFCALNVLSYSMGPEEVLSIVAKLAEESLDKAVSTLRERASTLSRRVSGRVPVPGRAPMVIDFAQFAQMAERTSPGVLARARAYARERDPGDKAKQTLAVLQILCQFAGLEGPAAVVGFSPPYYPRVQLDDSRHGEFISTLRSLLSDFAREMGASIRMRPFFPGISDMSFLSPSDTAVQREFAADRSPAADPAAASWETPLFSCPLVNIGPWGRDYHQAGERVHREYAFTYLPDLLFRLTQAMLLDPGAGIADVPAAGRSGR